MRLEQGDKVDRYEVEKLLGAGGTAMVYRVRHATLGTVHALKLLSISGDSIRRRLMQEGRAQATLRHPNIVSVTDIVTIDEQPALLMEYIEGPTLEDALSEHVLSLEDAETLFRGILSGVKAAHAVGIVHRDLKPANVMLDPTPDGYVPKVTDFGLAKAVRGPQREGSTRQGVAMGTPSYMAPEQIRDATNVDQRADVFSLGCVLYELIARQRPFGGDDVLEIYTRIAKGHYIPIRTLAPELPERLVNAIQGALQVDRSHRIPDCETFEAIILGERTWKWAAPPQPPEDLPPPPSLRSDAPPLTLAPRAVNTPAPSPMDARVVVEQPEAGNTWLATAILGVAIGLLILAVLVAGVGIAVPLLIDRQAERTTVEVIEKPVPVPVISPQPASEPIEAGDTDVGAPDADVDPDVEPTERVGVQTPAPATAPTPMPARTVQMKITSKPHLADIYVDGEFIQKRTPYKVELSAGSHRIDLHSDGRRGSFVVTAAPGKPTSHCFAFLTGTHHVGRCP